MCELCWLSTILSWILTNKNVIIEYQLKIHLKEYTEEEIISINWSKNYNERNISEYILLFNRKKKFITFTFTKISKRRKRKRYTRMKVQHPAWRQTKRMDWWNETKQKILSFFQKLNFLWKKSIKRFEFTYTACVVDEYWNVIEKNRNRGEKANKNDF